MLLWLKKEMKSDWKVYVFNSLVYYKFLFLITTKYQAC
jgi:hypothetical protein